jgi:hypothetical protein
MMDHGALEEVSSLKAQQPKEGANITKTLGYQEFLSYLDGDMTLDDAIAKAQQKSRNYAKRQVGNKGYGGQSSPLPLKLNMSGVIPPIFASSITRTSKLVGRVLSACMMTGISSFCLSRFSI